MMMFRQSPWGRGTTAATCTAWRTPPSTPASSGAPPASPASATIPSGEFKIQYIYAILLKSINNETPQVAHGGRRLPQRRPGLVGHEGGTRARGGGGQRAGACGSRLQVEISPPAADNIPPCCSTVWVASKTESEIMTASSDCTVKVDNILYTLLQTCILHLSGGTRGGSPPRWRRWSWTRITRTPGARV